LCGGNARIFLSIKNKNSCKFSFFAAYKPQANPLFIKNNARQSKGLTFIGIKIVVLKKNVIKERKILGFYAKNGIDSGFYIPKY
jgi:hypothetical protein